MKIRKKLIEVTLPLEAINSASAHEKAIRRGHPSTLHIWWARRPLATARAVIFSQLVDDPEEYIDELLADHQTNQAAERAYFIRHKSWQERNEIYEKAHSAGVNGAANPEPGPPPTLEETATALERQRLFRIIEDLVQWKNTNNESVLQSAREEIWRSWRRTCKDNPEHTRNDDLFDPQKLPAFHDPFAGGGSLPLEAQRLGLNAYASDLNPVAVLINKAMIEIPPKFAGRPAVNPGSRRANDNWSREWQGTLGLAEDVQYYGNWMRNEAEKRIGFLYPKVEITAEMVRERPDLKTYAGRRLIVIAWLWARTVKSPNPAFSQVDVPLVANFMLSKKDGKYAYVEPMIEKGGYRFTVKVGKPKDADVAENGTKLARGANFQCLMSGTPIPSEHIYREANAGRMGARLMAIVADGERGRVYLAPTPEMEDIALTAKPEWKPELAMPENPRWFSPPLYGLKTYGDLFTSRQLVALTTLSDLVKEAREQVEIDASAAGLANDSIPINNGGIGALAYADAVAVYLSLAVSKSVNRATTLCTFKISVECPGDTFGRQALPMSWDYAEANTIGGPSGSFQSMVDNTVAGLLSNNVILGANGLSCQSDAATQIISLNKVVSTDPPYYDNIGYADLSDFFYIWLRRSVKSIYPELFATISVPKLEELVATPYRHGSKDKAEKFFLDGMTQAMHRLSEQAHPAFPVTIYYAFKQSESDGNDGTINTGWETFLDAVIRAGFAVTGTWPVRTERENRKINQGTNALASSIVLVCRKPEGNPPTTTRRDFVNVLANELPAALVQLQAGNIVPVDLAQAAIGPGMAVYTRYSQVLDAQGQPLSVRQALVLINQTLDEALAKQEGDFDADTRWALAWFEQSGFAEGDFGTAETLSKAKDTSVAGMVEAGILASGRGKVRLLKPVELPKDWDPTTDRRLTAWEMVHQLIRTLESDGEKGAAQLMAKLGTKAETARELCYRLYTLCERKNRTAEALSYNALVQSWPEAQRLAREGRQPTETQAPLF